LYTFILLQKLSLLLEPFLQKTLSQATSIGVGGHLEIPPVVRFVFAHFTLRNVGTWILALWLY
jgi:hypothetical protein